VRLQGAAGLFQIPVYKKRPGAHHYNTKCVKIQNETKSAGHPTVFSFWEEKYLTAMLKDLTGRGFG
jgi:hypothetical protein